MRKEIGLLFMLGLAGLQAVPMLARAEAVWSRNQAQGIPAGLLTAGFLDGHPDLRWRGEGLAAFNARDYPRAMECFQRAARYADKYSQLMVARLYWEGLGVPRDPALGYVWMDLAAERMYHDFLVLRENYWDALDPAQREDAVRRGLAVFDEYADRVAKPRLERILRREGRNVTGSRLGNRASVEVTPMNGAMAGEKMRGDDYYAQQYWEPESYWRLQDAYWKPPLKERVDVGLPEVVRADGGG